VRGANEIAVARSPAKLDRERAEFMNEMHIGVQLAPEPTPSSPWGGCHSERAAGSKPFSGLGRFALFAALCPYASAAPVDFNFSTHDVKTTVFDASGHLVRRLSAQTATGPIDATQLEQGRIEFFSPSSAVAPTAVLTFDHALYQQTDGTIRGEDGVKLTSAGVIISGQGYECRLATGELALRSNVIIDYPGMHLTGGEAEIRFDAKGHEGEILKEITVKKQVVVVGDAVGKDPVDRAETSVARYNPAEQKIYLKNPVLVWRNGERGEISTAEDYTVFDVIKKRGGPPPGGKDALPFLRE
jgi:hypothetical protein